MRLTNWGNYPAVEAEERGFADRAELEALFQRFSRFITRGLGRSYGDSSLNTQIVSSLKYDRITAFDQSTGMLECQAGISLGEIISFAAPNGYFPPVTPGTKFVTVGGAIAADVHGKNHHIEGSFSRYIEELSIMLADGGVVRCSRAYDPELFAATCGGMGLTGVILGARMRLKKIETSWIKQRTFKAPNIESLMELFEQNASARYSVAWLDCLSGGSSLGRGILMLGEHAEKGAIGARPPISTRQGRAFNVPFHFPNGLLNRATSGLFNSYYYASHGAGEGLVHHDTFFYPLDTLLNWNRIYGRRGLCQYQLVLPKAASRQGIPRIIKAIAQSGEGSFLAVLKLLGKEANLLSFPMEGYTLALDFPLTKNLFTLFKELDKLVQDNGGRLYLAKDARMPRAMIEGGYPHLNTFRAIRERVDPGRRFSSLQSERLGL